MRSSAAATPLILTVASLALQASAATPTTKCNADNCARAVTGTAKGVGTLAAHLADCSSFQWATFTPDTLYVCPFVYLSPHLPLSSLQPSKFPPVFPAKIQLY